jgi:hypothetical protein
MNHYFFDTSALIKRYVVEVGSTLVNQWITLPNSRIYLSRLTEAEVSAALTRRLSPNDAARILQNFDQDLAGTYWPIMMTPATLDLAVHLTRTRRLRGCDSLQLATALQVVQLEPTVIFVCSDLDLLVEADAEGLTTANPTT